MNNRDALCETIEALHANNVKTDKIACLLNQSADANPSPVVMKKSAEKIQEASRMIPELQEALEVEAAQ